MRFDPEDAPLDTRYDRLASKELGADHWRILSPFGYKISENEWITIPVGYLTDGASVPQIFWNMIPPWGVYGQAAVVHDILCEYLAVVRDGVKVDITRARCDEILNEAMKVLGVPMAKRLMIYWAVCAYRLVSGVSQPSNTPKKRAMEANWQRGVGDVGGSARAAFASDAGAKG